MNIALALTILSAVAGFVMMMGGIIASMIAADQTSVEIESSLPAMKAAWRSGEWREPAWRRLFVIATGAGLMTVGLFGIFIVIGPWPVKILCAWAILYPAHKLVLALRRLP